MCRAKDRSVFVRQQHAVELGVQHMPVLAFRRSPVAEDYGAADRAAQGVCEQALVVGHFSAVERQYPFQREDGIQYFGERVVKPANRIGCRVVIFKQVLRRNRPGNVMLQNTGASKAFAPVIRPPACGFSVNITRSPPYLSASRSEDWRLILIARLASARWPCLIFGMNNCIGRPMRLVAPQSAWENALPYTTSAAILITGCRLCTV